MKSDLDQSIYVKKITCNYYMDCQLLIQNCNILLWGNKNIYYNNNKKLIQNLNCRSCCMVYACFGVLYTNSITHTAGILINRLSMVIYRKYLISTRKNLVFVIILCLIISIVLVTSAIFSFFNCENNLHFVVVRPCSLDKIATRGFLAYSGIVYLFIETIIILAYVLLLTNLYTHFNKMKLLRLKSMPGHIKSKEWKLKSNLYKHELKSLITLGVMLVVFVVLSTPGHVELTLEGFGVVTDYLELRRTIMFSLASTNSMVNPIVFCLRVPEVKNSILQFYRRIMRKLHRNRIAPQAPIATRQHNNRSANRPRIINVQQQVSRF